MINQTNIVADFREVPSKIPEILKELGAHVELAQLKTGDYIINNEFVVERKSREDFILSIIRGRLFSQCARMKKSNHNQIILIEGNPYNTHHKIDRQAIKGALLSLTLSWQIPVIYSANPVDSAHILLMAANQLLKEGFNFRRGGYKPKKLKSRAIYFLQGLPAVGSITALALLEKFDTLENVILATRDELMEIEGLGKTKVKRIRNFLSTSFHSRTS